MIPNASWPIVPNGGPGSAIGSPVITGTPGSVLFIDSSGNLAQDTAAISWDDTNKIFKLVGGQVRQPLLADTSFFVATSGNDSTGNGTSVSPWATIQHAYDTIAGNYDLNNFKATISLASGTYTSGLVISKPWSGGGAMALVGSGVGSCTISTIGNHCITNTACLPGSFFVSGYTLTCATGSVNCISNFNAGGPIVINGNISFGAAALAHIYTQFFGVIIIASNYQIDGDAQYHYVVDRGGNINANNAYTITVNGARTFTGQVGHANGISSLGPFQGTVFTLAGGASVTGVRFGALLSSLILTGSGGDPNFFPGSIAGTTSSGSLYDGVQIGATIGVDGIYTSAAINQQGFINWQGNAFCFGSQAFGGATTPGIQFMQGTTDVLDYNVSNGPRWSMFAPFWLGANAGVTIGNLNQLVFQGRISSGSTGPHIVLNNSGPNDYIGIGQKDLTSSDLWIGGTAGANTAWDTSSAAGHTVNVIAFNGYLAAGTGGTEVIKLDPVAKTINQTAVAVASLPAAGTAGRRAFVTDANATTFASIVASGGTNKIPVYDDGTNWRIG